MIIDAKSNNHKNIMFKNETKKKKKNETLYLKSATVQTEYCHYHEHKILPFGSNSRILPGLPVLACIGFLVGSTMFSEFPGDE